MVCPEKGPEGHFDTPFSLVICLLKLFCVLPQSTSQCLDLADFVSEWCLASSVHPPSKGFPVSDNGKEPTCQSRRHIRRHGFDPWVRKILWRRQWQSTPVFLPEESHEQRSAAGYTVEAT